MKKTLFILGFLFLSYSYTSAITCLDLEKDKIDQVTRLESAKIRIFEQESSFIDSIRNKKDLTLDTVASSTQDRINGVRSIISELEALKNPSRGIRTTVNILNLAVNDYATKTSASLLSFNDSVDRITADRNKSIKSIVDQYESDLLQTYEKSKAECLDGAFDVDIFDTQIKSIRKRVVDSQKNTRRMTQGIDATYAKLNFELNDIDTNLNKSLKSVRPTIKRELTSTEAPLSFLQLIRML